MLLCIPWLHMFAIRDTNNLNSLYPEAGPRSSYLIMPISISQLQLHFYFCPVPSACQCWVWALLYHAVSDCPCHISGTWNIPLFSSSLHYCTCSVHSLEKEMAIHSSTIAWKIPWTEETGRLQSMGSQRVGHDWATSLFTQFLFWLWMSLFCYKNLIIMFIIVTYYNIHTMYYSFKVK